MESGFTRATASETPLHRLQIQVYTSQRTSIDAAKWNLDLQSPFWRVYVNPRAGAFLIFQSERLEILPGQLTVIPAWVRFQTGTGAKMAQDYLHFYLSGASQITLRALFARPYSFDLKALFEGSVARWRESLERQSAGETPDLAAFAEVYALSYAALGACAQRENLGAEAWTRPENSPLSPALEALENRLGAPPANGELARLCGLSTDHFIRQFRQSVGQTPAQYGLAHRVAVAARLLLSTAQSIEEIAARTGFSDRFHFSKSFKTRFGSSPAAYRILHHNRS